MPFVSTYSPYGPSQLSPWHTAMFAAQQPVNNNMRTVEGCVTTEIPCLGRAHDSNAGNKTVGVKAQAVMLEAETDTIRSCRKIWFHSLCCDSTQSPLALETGKQTRVLLVGRRLQLQPMSPDLSWCPSSYAGSDFCCSQTVISKNISQSLGALKLQLKGCWVSPSLNEENEMVSTNGSPVKDTDHLCYHRRPIWNTFDYWKPFQHQRTDERNSWRNEKTHVFSEQFCAFLHVQRHVLAGVRCVRVMASRLLVGEQIRARL